MKHYIYITQLILALTLCLGITACSSEDQEDQQMDTCEYVRDDNSTDGIIDETESAIMRECLENEMTDENEIRSNLVGTWNIVGHGQGWLTNVAQPCGSATFTESEVTFRFEDIFQDTMLVKNYFLDTGFAGISLNIESDHIYSLSCNTFCERYMYFDHTPLDGNMYLWEKQD